MNPTNPQPSERVGELREQINMEMLEKSSNAKDLGDFTVVPLGFAVDVALDLITSRIQAFAGKVEEVVIGENEQFGPVPYKPVRNEMRIKQRQALARLLQAEVGQKAEK